MPLMKFEPVIQNRVYILAFFEHWTQGEAKYTCVSVLLFYERGGAGENSTSLSNFAFST